VSWFLRNFARVPVTPVKNDYQLRHLQLRFYMIMKGDEETLLSLLTYASFFFVLDLPSLCFNVLLTIYS
jgi:hypothetical protein